MEEMKRAILNEYALETINKEFEFIVDILKFNMLIDDTVGVDISKSIARIKTVIAKNTYDDTSETLVDILNSETNNDETAEELFNSIYDDITVDMHPDYYAFGNAMEAFRTIIESVKSGEAKPDVIKIGKEGTEIFASVKLIANETNDIVSVLINTDNVDLLAAFGIIMERYYNDNRKKKGSLFTKQFNLKPEKKSLADNLTESGDEKSEDITDVSVNETETKTADVETNELINAVETLADIVESVVSGNAQPGTVTIGEKSNSVFATIVLTKEENTNALTITMDSDNEELCKAFEGIMNNLDVSMKKDGGCIIKHVESDSDVKSYSVDVVKEFNDDKTESVAVTEESDGDDKTESVAVTEESDSDETESVTDVITLYESDEEIDVTEEDDSDIDDILGITSESSDTIAEESSDVVDNTNNAEESYDSTLDEVLGISDESSDDSDIDSIVETVDESYDSVIDDILGLNDEVVESMLADETTIEESSTDGTVVKESSTDETVVTETAYDNPVVTETAYDNPVVTETVVEETTDDETTEDNPVAIETVAEETTGDETTIDETTGDETTIDETTGDEIIETVESSTCAAKDATVESNSESGIITVDETLVNDTIESVEDKTESYSETKVEETTVTEAETEVEEVDVTESETKVEEVAVTDVKEKPVSGKPMSLKEFMMRSNKIKI